ncbi:MULTISPECIES: universal stress protein [Pseudomonas]|uniref:universal stress protein n=1 Tax=Pseudomonas sp. MIL9 TaxID=2807620 RepID=UPI00102A9792|nr:universal stress protein [Pseudomonas sp. MIL9]MBM6446775.1 universal stress protein [Pseudomonas sp. MIL9]RZO05630.1 universal stress protein [Pseudomonas moorei]
MTRILACIDSTNASPAVCDYAAWASLNFGLPLTLLNVVNRPSCMETQPGSLAHMLDSMTLDERRHERALKQGYLMLQNARERAITDGVMKPELRQKNGELLCQLLEMENDMRWLVMGKQSSLYPLLNQLEKIIDALHKPILVTPTTFKAPRSLVLAYDASEVTHMGVEMLAASPILKNLAVHLVMVAAKTPKNLEQLDSAEAILKTVGCDVRTAICDGKVNLALQAYQTEHNIDLLVMGAFSHSRAHRFWLGSTTSRMIRTTTHPLLFLPKSHLNM